jgi:hypothetical protein
MARLRCGRLVAVCRSQQRRVHVDNRAVRVKFRRLKQRGRRNLQTMRGGKKNWLVKES